MSTEQAFYTTKAAAEWLTEHGVVISVSTLNRLAAAKKKSEHGPAFHKTSMRRMYPRQALAEFAEKRLGQPVKSITEYRLHELQKETPLKAVR